MDCINIALRSYTIILIISTLSVIAGSNINCNGKAFHCVNSTHFKICVDLGGGVSTTVDEFLIPCPRNTVCKQYNLFECEYELTTTHPPVTIPSEVTNEQIQISDSSLWEQLDITTIFPMKQQPGMELSEKYYNKVKTTPASFTSSLLTDAVIKPVNTSNANDLYTNSNNDINKSLNNFRSIDKGLAFFTTESGIGVTQKFSNNVNILVPDIGVSSNGNFSDPPLQESIPQVSNITDLIKSDNKSQERNLDLVIIYNTTQINKSENNTQYRNTNTDKLISSTPNVITNEKLASDGTNENKKSKMNSVSTPKLSTQHSAEATTSNYPISLNTVDAIETFLNEGKNITTNLEKLSISDGDFFSTYIIPETSDVKTNKTSNQITNSRFNYGISNTALDNPIIEVNNTTPSITPQPSDKKITNYNEILNFTNKFGHNFTTESNSVNIPQYLITTETYLYHGRSDVPKSSTPKSETTLPINTSKVLYLNSKEATQDNAYQIDNLNFTESDLVLTKTSINQLNPSLLPTSATKTATYDNITVGVYNFTGANILPVLTTEKISIEIASSKPLSDLFSMNETWPEPIVMIGLTGLDNKIITTTETSNNITAENYNEVTRLKALSDVISKNESWQKPIITTTRPVVMIDVTDLENNNITTTERNNNISAEKYSGVVSSKKISDLTSKNETWPAPFVMIGVTDLDNKIITTTETSNNITAEKYNEVTSLKPLSDVISKNESWQKSIVTTVATNLDNNNIATKETSNKITVEISNGVTSLKPSASHLISQNETWPEPVVMMDVTDLDNNNITTTERSNSISAEKYSGVVSSKPFSDLISKNETWPAPIVMIGVTDLDNKIITTTETSNNITAEKYNEVTNLKPLSDVISKNESWQKSIVTTVATNLDNNNIATKETSNKITVEISNEITSMIPLSDLVSNNETRPEPVVMINVTGLDKNNMTTTDTSNNITAENYNVVTSLKPISDLMSNNESWPKPFVVTIATNLDNNNITTTKPSNNTAVKTPNEVTSLESFSQLILKNETWPEPVAMINVTVLDNNNLRTTDTSNNITVEKYNGVKSFKSLSDVISKNVSWPKSVMTTVASNPDNNNILTTETSNNITMEISKIHSTDFKLLLDSNTFDSIHEDHIFETIRPTFTDNQALHEATTSLSGLTKNSDYILKLKHLNKDSVGLMPFTDSAISDLKQNTPSNTSSLFTAIGTHPILINKVSDVNETKSKIYKISDLVITGESSTLESVTGTAAFESTNSIDVKNNTFAVIDELSKYRVESDNGKSMDNTSKFESNKTTTPSTNFVSNTSSKQGYSETTIIIILSSESAKEEMNKKRAINTNTSNIDEILGKNSSGNLNFNKLSTENTFVSKLVTSNNFTLSPDLNVSNKNHNITYNDNNKYLKDNGVKYNPVTSNLDMKSLTFNVINVDNVVSSSNSTKNPLKQPLSSDIYNASPPNIGSNVSSEPMLERTTEENKQHESEYKESNQINQNGLAGEHAVQKIEHKGGKETEFLQPYPYHRVTSTAIDVNDTTRSLKELSHNFSEPSLTINNNVKHELFMDNITTDKTKKHDTKGSGVNNSNSTTYKLIKVNNYKNRSELADNFPSTEITNKLISGNVIKPLFIAQEPMKPRKKELEKVNNTSSLYEDNKNLSHITGGLRGHVSDSKVNSISNKNRSEHIAYVKNITTSNNFLEDSINSARGFNKTIVARPTKTFTYDSNDSKFKSFSILRSGENYTTALNAASITTNNLLRNTSSLTNSIKNNKTHHVISSNTFEYSRIPAKHDESNQTTGPSNISKIGTTPLHIKIPEVELGNKQDRITKLDPSRYINTNRSNGIDEKQLRNGQGFPESILANRNNTPNSYTTPINNFNYSETKYGNIPLKQEFSCSNRGKYSDKNDCNKFYVCIGRVKPIIGVCPTGTVFSEYLKQCTKNITHCIRNNEFKCTAAGRFINILCNNTYFICANKKSGFIRFTLKCQKGYYLDKHNIKCTPKLTNNSISDENNSKNTKELSFYKEMKGVSVNSKNVFECEKEGKFKDPQDCRKYYICKKGKKSTFRRKIKQCDSDEVFHGKKKKCVDKESYECNI